MIGRYENLEVWKEAFNLAIYVYKVTVTFPKIELYGIVSQIRRAAISITCNISEGVGRRSKGETVQFLYIARSSLYELDNLIRISNHLSYLNAVEYKTLESLIEKTARLLSGLINFYTDKSTSKRPQATSHKLNYEKSIRNRSGLRASVDSV